MSTLREFGSYAHEYLAAATQFATYRLAREWMDAGVPAADAAGWANLGLTPAEAAPLIRDGITPQAYRELEDHAEEQAGGRDALVAQRVAQMVEAGEIVDSDRGHPGPGPHRPAPGDHCPPGGSRWPLMTSSPSA